VGNLGRHGTSGSGRSIDYANAHFCHSTNFSLVKNLCRFIINVKYIRRWRMLLSLKRLLIAWWEFLFLEPRVHGVNKPENDVGQLKEKDLQISLVRPNFLLHKVTFP
jgi:hypothetical protein